MRGKDKKISERGKRLIAAKNGVNFANKRRAEPRERTMSADGSSEF